MAKERGDVLQGTLDMLVLKALQLEPMHGWGITERIEQWSESVLQLGQGTLYPALYRLERQGLIRSEWKVTENNRRARYYSLTRVRPAAAERRARAVAPHVPRGQPCARRHHRIVEPHDETGSHEGWRWIRSIGRRHALERGLDEEIRFHIDQQTEKNRRAGMRPDEARRQALIKFGGLEGVKERTRDEIRPALLEDSVRDIRHGLRVLRRAPGFTAAALVTLALGIGATSAIFSVVRTVMLEPLPYHEPDRIVAVWETNRGGTSRNVIAPANFVAWRERTRTLEHLGMVGPGRRGHDHRRPAYRVAGLARLLRRLSRARRPACARPRLHGRGRLRRQRRSSCSATSSGSDALAAARTCST